MNINKLRGKFTEKGYSLASVAEQLDIDRSTLHRKLSNEGEGFTILEANKIVKMLELSPEEAVSIFFVNTVA